MIFRNRCVLSGIVSHVLREQFDRGAATNEIGQRSTCAHEKTNETLSLQADIVRKQLLGGRELMILPAQFLASTKAVMGKCPNFRQIIYKRQRLLLLCSIVVGYIAVGLGCHEAQCFYLQRLHQCV